MNLSDFKTNNFMLNSRAKIKIKPVVEYNAIKGYYVSLYYKIKNKIFNNYDWVTVNKIYISEEDYEHSSKFKKSIKNLLNRKSKQQLEHKKKILSLKMNIKKEFNSKYKQKKL